MAAHPLKLFIANKNYSSWSLRPWVLMRMLAIPFDEQLVPFGAGSQAEVFGGFSPSGKVPCLVDDATVVWDSLAIIEYLAEAHPQAWPADRGARAWARSAAAEMHSGFFNVRNLCSMNCGVRVRIDPWPPALQAEWNRLSALWDEGLARFDGPFLTGSQFTAVDAFFAPLAFRAQTYSPPLSARSNEYLARLRALPAMQAWYADALAEPWRHDGHEEEVRAAGTLLQDLRIRGHD
jgi:glutathione S-transferase